MKKLTSLLLILVVAPMFSKANTTLNVINATLNYTLYFNTVSKTSSCYPEIREYNPSGTSGYCTLAAGGSIAFADFTTLNSYYPGLTFTKKNSSGATAAPLSLLLANTYLTSLSMNWAYIIYKVTHNTTGHTEGVWLGFSDFSSCHGLPDSWGTYGTTDTESFTSFTVGNDRYFVVGEY
jgi:hypothetical protein